MNDAQTGAEISADGKTEPGLELCPFCAKPFVLHSPKAEVTAFQHYSEGCPLHEAEMQFINLPIETMTAMLNHRPVEHVLTRCVQAESERADAALERENRAEAEVERLRGVMTFAVRWINKDLCPVAHGAIETALKGSK